MRCPICSRKTRVTRTTHSSTVIRHRECKACGVTFKTSESILLPPSLKVVKADGRDIEPYDRQKMAKTIEWLARRSQELTPQMREKVLQEVEYRVLTLVRQEVVSTGLLAEMLFETLSRWCPNAAERFASRYTYKNGQPLFRREIVGLRGGSYVDTSRQLWLFDG